MYLGHIYTSTCRTPRTPNLEVLICNLHVIPINIPITIPMTIPITINVPINIPIAITINYHYICPQPRLVTST